MARSDLSLPRLAVLTPHEISRIPDMPDTLPWAGPEGERFNIASYMPARAAERPFQKALVMPHGHDLVGKRMYSHLTFAQLNALCDAYAHGLKQQGFRRGDRVVMMVSQGLELITIMYALFKLGCVPVAIDPGMGPKSFLACVEEAEPVGMIGIPRGHRVKKVFRGPFRSVKRAIITESKWWAGVPSLGQIADFSKGEFPIEDTARDELAAILFTSGSTGIPKGVHYTHGIFGAQTRFIGALYGIEPGEIEVPAFPLFSMFSVALGMTCVVPDMDPTKPAEVAPENIIEAILDHGATTAFASPAVWLRVADYCEANRITLPTIRRIMTAGAPINPALMRQLEGVLPEGTPIHTPYGATECLPVASVSSLEVLAETAEMTDRGAGICVGHAAPDMKVRIVRITDEAIPTWADAEELAAGEIGEICVQGPVATRAYDRKPEHTALAKIADDSEREDGFWHRMGDVGYLDARGRLWYCGRKKHRVETAQGTMFTIPCEAIFNALGGVRRSALVGIGAEGAKTPVLIVEPAADDRFPDSPRGREAFRKMLAAHAERHELTRPIEHVLFHDGFPVDRRHNAKIHREELAVWAEGVLRNG